MTVIDISKLKRKLHYIYRVYHLSETVKSKIYAAIEDSKIPQIDPRGWISVKDALPENDGAYLCYCAGYSVDYQRIVYFTHHAELDFDLNYEGCKGSVWYAYDSEYGNFTMNNITHWMPLPSDPEKKEETSNDKT